MKTSLDFQYAMNNIIAKKIISTSSYKKACTYYIHMNLLRLEEGKKILTLDSIHERIKNFPYLVEKLKSFPQLSEIANKL